jgi:hypothetical protein
MTRGLAAAAMVSLLIAGTLWGADDHFPFAPMRMYAHRTSGSVKELKLLGTTTSGREIPISFAAARVRRAEVAGQVPRFEARPELMRHLADAYRSAHPEEPLIRLELLYLVYPLARDGRPGLGHEDVVAVWTRR